MSDYDEDYYINGRKSGKSLYENYRWLPELTIPMAHIIAGHLRLTPADRVLDFGCSRGYLVRALVEIGFDAYGIDVSEWAVKNCDETVRDRVFNSPPAMRWNYVIAKDTLEHIEPLQLSAMISHWGQSVMTGIFVVVPLAEIGSGCYVVPEYELDVTHKIRWSLGRWVEEFHIGLGSDWKVTSQYLLPGVKDNYAKWKTGNGFITCSRVS